MVLRLLLAVFFLTLVAPVAGQAAERGSSHPCEDAAASDLAHQAAMDHERGDAGHGGFDCSFSCGCAIGSASTALLPLGQSMTPLQFAMAAFSDTGLSGLSGRTIAPASPPPNTRSI